MGIANFDKARAFRKLSDISFNGERAELVRLSTVGTHSNSVPTKVTDPPDQIERIIFRRTLENSSPTVVRSIVFATRVAGLRIKRGIRNRFSGPTRLERNSDIKLPVILAEVRTPLHTADNKAERALELGKIQNLRIAATSLDGILIAPNEVFSFWRNVGPCYKSKGYRAGRQLQEGCIIPAVGGGICQLSNSLYQAALQANVEIVERHPHSKVIPGSFAERGTDATVAWNYIDLQFKPAKTI